MAGKNLLAEEPSTGGKNLLAGEPREKPFGQKVMEYAVTPALETVGTIVGGTIGGGGGTIFGPIGTAVGTVGGAVGVDDVAAEDAVAVGQRDGIVPDA